MEFVNTMFDAINNGVEWVFSINNVALWLAFGLIGWSVGIILFNYWKRYKPFTRQLEQRLSATQTIGDAPDDAEAQRRFADQFEQINTAMLASGAKSARLRHAWTQFCETIVGHGNGQVLRATARPDGYFLHLGDETRVLAWWANIFVAIGLTFTFLGIVAALHKTVTIMTAGADQAGMLGALTGLLKITAAKFWTSIGGVVASIILRVVDRHWHSRMDQRLEQLCDRLEYGTLFQPAQQIAALQLDELKQQTTALTEFSHQLAASIGDAFNQHIQPVVAGLQGIQTSIDTFKDDTFKGFGTEMGTALRDSAGAEMQALAGVLTQMTEKLGGVNDRLEGASGAASEQIASAAREFSTASEQMTKAFAALNGGIERMADRIAEQGNAAEQRAAQRLEEEKAGYDAMAEGQRRVMTEIGEGLRSASASASEDMVRAVKAAVGEAMAESSVAIRGALDHFAGATSGIQSAFDQMRGQVAELGSTLNAGASDAASRNADVLKRAADALEASLGRAQGGMNEALDTAIARSAEESGRVMAAAFEAFGKRFDQASAGLVETLTTTAGRMEAVSRSIANSTDKADEHAAKLTAAGREAQAVGTMLGKAANDVSTATGPIREAATTIKESVGHSQELLRRSGEATERQRTAMDGIATSLERTGTAATQAFENYSSRFTEVDEALGRALEKIKSASAEHAGELNTQVGKIDLSLASAVDRLATAVDDIKELAGALEDLRGRYETRAAE